MKKRILVIDDDEDIVFVVKYYLEDKGFDVRTFTTSIDIKQYITEYHPDLLLLDINLKDGNGIDIQDNF